LKKLFHRVAGADLTRNSILVLAAILLGNIFNYAYYLLMGRTLSLRDYGTVMSLVSAALLVFGVGSVTQTVVAKLAADLRAGGDESRMAAFARAIVRLSIAAACLIFAAAALASGVLASYLRLDRPEPVVVAGAAAAVGFVALFQRGLFQGFGTFKSFAISSSLDGAKAFVVLPLAHSFGAMGALLAFLAGTMTTVTYGAVALRQRFKVVRDAAALDVRRLFRSAGATGVASISIVVLMFYDVVLAKHYVTPAGAGLYSAAALGGRAVLAACSFLPIILLPDVALRSASGRPHRHVLAAALAIAVAIIGIAVAACALKAKLVLAILAGHAFEGAAPLLLPYVVSSSGLAVANLLAMYAIARHSFGFIPYVIVIAVCEITAVTLRHASPSQIVQDILVGHLSICLAMSVWVALSLARASSPAPSTAA
jgi:O-antigen/teichoic acid export membrane protein